METTPRPYPWPDGHRAAVMISIDVDVDTPFLWRNRDEPEIRFIAEWEQRQHGVRSGIAAILGVLSRHGVPATFFVPGRAAERHPGMIPALIAAGHEVALHGHAHETVRETSDTAFLAALERSMAILTAQGGMPPRGFRAPGWEMTRAMWAALRERGLYDSSLAGLDWPYTLDGVVELPISWTREDTSRFKLTGLLDRWPPTSPLVVLDEWVFDAEATIAAGGLFTLTLHDWIAGRPAPLRVLDQLLGRITREPGVWIATGAALAAHHRALPEAAVSGFRLPDQR